MSDRISEIEERVQDKLTPPNLHYYRGLDEDVRYLLDLVRRQQEVVEAAKKLSTSAVPEYDGPISRGVSRGDLARLRRALDKLDAMPENDG